MSLYLDKNETLGLLGPNGAGKSTLFNILSTSINPNEGKVLTFGQPLHYKADFFKKAGLCAQDDIFWTNLDVDSNIKILRKMKGIPKNVADHWKEALTLNEFGDRRAENLSSGMRRKLCFIMGSIGNPQFKFLDEPSTGLDPVARLTMRDTMKA